MRLLFLGLPATRLSPCVPVPSDRRPRSSPSWAQLEFTAEAGSSVFSVSAQWARAVGLAPGDELVISPSNLTWDESDFCTVLNTTEINPGIMDVYTTAPLVHEHRGLANATWLDTHYHPFLAAEVALLRSADGAREAGYRVHSTVVVEGVDAEDDSTSAEDGAQGADEEFGVAVYILKRTDKCPAAMGRGAAEASANVSGVLFHHCGQRGWAARGCINVGPQQQQQRFRYQWETHGRRVSITDNTILDGYSSGIHLDRVHGASVNGNVLARVQRFGIKVEGQRNRILNNLIVHVADSNDKVNSGAMSTWSSRFANGKLHCYGLFHVGRDGLVTGNVVAGVEGTAALSDGYECGTPPTIHGNIAHSALVGLWYEERSPASKMASIFGSAGSSPSQRSVSSRPGYSIDEATHGSCYELSSWSVHSTIYYGAHTGRLFPDGEAFTHLGNRASLTYRNFTMIDTGVAFSHASEGPDSTMHDRSRPDLHWKVVGATVLASNHRCRQVGLVVGSFHNVAAAFGPLDQDMYGIRGSPSLYGGTVLADSYFDGFGVSESNGFTYESDSQITCSAGDHNVVLMNDAPPTQASGLTGERAGDGMWQPNADGSSPLFVSGLTFGAHVDFKYHFIESDPSFIGPTGCAQIACDGRRQSLIVDEDGSLLGSAGTIVAEAEHRFTEPLSYVDPSGAATPADLVPPSQAFDESGMRLTASEIYDHAGISRHSSAGTCSW